MARLLVFLVAAATLLPYGFAAAETPVRITGFPADVEVVAGGIEGLGPDDPPPWSVHLDSATADFDDMLVGRNASVWVRGVPVVPFLPVFATALGRQRQTGFLAPTFGSSTLRGFSAKLPFYWAISDSQDLTVSLDAYSKRGVGANAEYRYLLGGGARGSASGFFIQETEVTQDLRGFAHWIHTWPVDPTLPVKVAIN